MTGYSTDRRYWITALITLVLARAMGSIILPVYDDAFITFRYGVHLAEGSGFVYNVGERILGTTSPGFGLLVALLAKGGFHPPISVVVLNIVTDLLIGLLVIRTLVSNRKEFAATVFAGLFALSPMLTRICVGGMETPLFLLVSLFAIAMFVRQRHALAMILAALSIAFRPEGVILPAVFCASLLHARQWRPLVISGIIGCGVLLLLLIPEYLYFGDFLPQSVRSKSHAINSGLLTVVRGLIVPEPFSMVLLIPAVWGAFQRQGRSEFELLLAAWTASYVALYLVARPAIWSWYGEPVFFAEVYFASCAASKGLESLKRSANWRTISVASSAVTACVAVLVLIIAGPSTVTTHIYGPMSEWCSALPKESSILADDIGAVGFHSDRYIYDLGGLINPASLGYSDASAMINDRKPDYVVLTATQANAAMMLYGPLHEQYTPIKRFSKTASSEIYRDTLRYAPSWIQDYIVYERGQHIRPGGP